MIQPWILGVAFTIAIGQAAGFAHARYRSGDLPPLPVLAVGGGQALLEVTVERDGRVAAVKPLRETAPFSALLADAVRGWRFSAASLAVPPSDPASVTAQKTAVASAVLVAAVYRPPALIGPTLGEPSRDVALPSDGIPFPVSTTLPAYPPQALSGGVVLVEAEIASDGSVCDVRVVRHSSPFDGAALDAVRRWRFRPARRGGQPVPAIVYVVLGFPAPAGPPPITD